MSMTMNEIHTLTGFILPAPPFDFAQSLRFIGAFPPTQGEQSLGDLTLTQAYCLGGRAMVARVTSVGTVAAPRMEYTLFANAPITLEWEAQARDRIAFHLSLNDDLASWYAVAQEDAAFAPIVQQLYGYHQVKFPTPFENSCWAILTQRNPMPQARKMKAALLARYSPAMVVDGVEHRPFPEPALLAEAKLEDLNAAIRHPQKSERIRAVARAFAATDEQWLRSAPYNEVETWLKQIPGIGDWSANFVLIRGLGRTERVPLAEKMLAARVARLYGPGASIAEVAARYGPWQGYWAHYLRAAPGT